MKAERGFIVALDQGTTSSRAILFNKKGEIVNVCQKPFKQYFPKPGWVEHDPNEIWSSQASVAAEVVAGTGLSGNDIAAIGITNQRETTIVWDKNTGQPVYPAIVWQDRRTSAYCHELKEKELEEMIRNKTGLLLDAYFSATKIRWILENVSGARQKADNGDLLFGTVDSWLIYKFSQGKAHLTDITNASRTLLYNIHDLTWDEELLNLFEIPVSMLPEVRPSSGHFCDLVTNLFSASIPIAGVAGDQQAALFGQLCLEEGMLKTTYGTGCFMVMNTGSKPVLSDNRMLTTIAWEIPTLQGEQGKVQYALEGSVFVGGAVIEWLRDGLGILESAMESEILAATVEDNGGVFFLPALTGLGAPYWDQEARGAIFGITRGTTSAHITRAALEAIAFQVNDVLKAMEADYGKDIKEMRVDGGAVANNLLMQFQANIAKKPLVRPEIMETTAMGVAFMAGLSSGFWKDLEEIKALWKTERIFYPEMDDVMVATYLNYWYKAVNRALNWMDVD